MGNVAVAHIQPAGTAMNFEVLSSTCLDAVRNAMNSLLYADTNSRPSCKRAWKGAQQAHR